MDSIRSSLAYFLYPHWEPETFELRGTGTGCQDSQKTCEDLQNLESEDFSRISGFAKNKRGFAKNSEDSQN